MGRIDSFPINLQPATDGQETIHLRLGNNALGSGTYIQKVVAILAGDVRQVADQLL